jgi:hypothetical protein
MTKRYRALTFVQAEEIRRRAAAGEVQSHLAREYGVNPSGVTKIIKGKSYTGQPIQRSRRPFDPEGRKCTQCRQFKPWSEFSPSPTGLNGHSAWCHACVAADQRVRREVDPEVWKLRAFELGLKRKFNITLEQYQALGEAQGWVCALCGEPETRVASGKNTDGKTVQSLSVDHDHSCCSGFRSCGKCIRGLLCTHCNLLVGRLEGRRGALMAARLPEYLIQRPLAASVGVGLEPASPQEGGE